MIFGEIDSAINLIEKARKYFGKTKKPPESELVAARFIQLFEAHGVHRNQIPRFFGHALTLIDLKDNASLLLKLNEEMLEDVCQLFAVRREWLDGADKQIYPHHDFYKKPSECLAFINALKAANTDGQLDGILFAPEEVDINVEAILILTEVIGDVGDEPVYRYHLCNNWLFTYWKARGYLTACVALAWKNQVYVRGVLSSKNTINKLASGEILLGDPEESLESLSGKKWYPEDMALVPEVYLKEIDPERDNFGIKSGLDLWLKLDNEGLMDTGLQKEARSLFIQARDRVS